MIGIDVYQGDSGDGIRSRLKSIPEKAYSQSDFVIVKASQGLSYHYTGFFRNMIDRTLSDGKLGGAYHYAAGHDASEEAEYFLSVVKPYLGRIILCLDWESYQNKAWGSETWAKKFVTHVRKETGITCFLYTGKDGCVQCEDLIGTSPLWFAGYPKPLSTGWRIPPFHYDLGKWDGYTIWQYTNSEEKVDRNTSRLTAEEWMAYASDFHSMPDSAITDSVPNPDSADHSNNFLIPALPPRGYYRPGDGITALKNYPTQIKRIQQCLNLALEEQPGYVPLTVDGKYGKLTEEAVRLFQKVYKLKDVDGLWGKCCNAKMEGILSSGNKTE